MRNSDSLAFFPDPYPDEDFRNLVIRYSHKTNNSIVNTMEKLFNIKTASPNYFPYNLEFLVNKLPYNKEEFIEEFVSNNTFFPVYSLFLPSDLSEKILKDFEKVDSKKDLSILSLRHNIHKNFRFCSECIKEDYEQGRQPYAHRIHQFNNLDICLFHNRKLISKCPTCDEWLYKENNINPSISVEKCKNGHKFSSEEINSNNIVNLKLKVLQSLYFLLENYKKLKGFPVYNYYKNYLISKGYMQYSGKLNTKDFNNDFIQFFSKDSLEKLGLDIHKLNNRLALRIFTKDKYSYDPILHILAMIFLVGSVEEFFNKPLPVLKCEIPFGLGPWCCLNTVCKYHGKQVISHCRRFISRYGNFFGEFKCTYCGFHYKQKYEEHVSNKDWKLWVIDYGPVWNDRLIELNMMGVNHTEIGRKLNVRRSTVREYINGTYKKHYNQEQLPTNVEKIQSGKLQQLKEQVEKLSKEKSMTRSKISEILGSRNYRLLLKREPEWMQAVLPAPVFNFKEKDWDNLDICLSKTLEIKIKKLYENKPNRRITKYLIFNQIDASDKKKLIQHPNRLPLSLNIIQKNIESKESYQLRIIPHTLHYMKSIGSSLDPEIIYSLKTFKGCTENVKQKILFAIKEYTTSP